MTTQFKPRGIVKRFGQWAVTAFGLENLTGPVPYEIEKVVLGHGWWVEHMSRKRWVILADFERALSFARRHFAIGGVATDADQIHEPTFERTER